MKNLGQMLKQAQEVQAKMAEMQEKLMAIELAGASGGGMVKVTLTGKHMMRSLKIDPSLIDPADAGMLEDLIVAAFNDAKGKVDSFMAEEMAKITGGLQLPPDLAGDGAVQPGLLGAGAAARQADPARVCRSVGHEGGGSGDGRRAHPPGVAVHLAREPHRVHRLRDEVPAA